MGLIDLMDPKQQECFSRYLYGAGYMARDDNTLGLLTGNGSKQPHFCLKCPVKDACENEHEMRVRSLLPEEAETFDRLMREARARDIPPTLAAVKLGQQGLDPYANTAIENFKEGHADRSRVSGRLAG